MSWVHREAVDSLRDKKPVFRYRYLDEISNTRIALYIFGRRRVRGAKDKKGGGYQLAFSEKAVRGQFIKNLDPR